MHLRFDLRVASAILPLEDIRAQASLHKPTSTQKPEDWNSRAHKTSDPRVRTNDGLGELLAFAEIDYAVLTGEREAASAAALQRYAADPVITGVVRGQGPVILDQQSASIRKEHITQVILRIARREPARERATNCDVHTQKASEGNHQWFCMLFLSSTDALPVQWAVRTKS